MGKGTRRTRLGVSAVAALALALPAAAQAAGDLVISQVYGGGGNSGATLTNDYVELFNRGSAPASLDGYSVQYASATGTGNFSATPLSGTLQPGQRYLVQQAAGSGGTTPLPTPDATGSIAMSATAGKVALVASSTALACNGGSTPCSPAQLAQIADLVGYGTANFFEGAGAAPALTNTTAALRAAGGCTDTDANAADLTAGAPDPRNSAAPPTPCVAVAPGITLTQSGGATTAAEGGATDTFTLRLATVPAAPVTVTLTPDSQVAVSPAAVELTGTDPVTVTVSAVDDAAVEGPHTGTVSFAVASADAAYAALTVPGLSVAVADDDVDECTLPSTPIHEVQGAGAATPLAGQPVTVDGVVVGDFEGPSPALRGFYVQEPAADADADAATSEGVFVFNGNRDDVAVGQRVRVSGTAQEFQDQTQIGGAVGVVACGTGTVEPVDVDLPVPAAGHLERHEAMLVRFPGTLTVTELFQLGRFGQVTLSSGGRLPQPTDVVPPGAPAQALQAQNDLRRIILDDSLQSQNPDPIVFARGGSPLSASNTLRGGDTVSGLRGVLTYTWAGNSASGNAFRVRPLGALGERLPAFQPANPRPAGPPDVGGRLKVAGFNVLNYFNTFTGCTTGVGGAATDCRGAEDATEFERQAAKVVDAIVTSGADVVALNEVENDGYDPASALADLTGRLNAVAGPGAWAHVDADAGTGQANVLGDDAIKVALLYRVARVTPVGRTAALNTGAFGPFQLNGGGQIQRSRPALAQAFEETATGARVVVVANHLKSKGSACDDNLAPAPADVDTGDGQGNCNQTRLLAARELAAWLAGDPTQAGDPDVLIMGDLNSYAMEDPVRALQDAGYTDLVEDRLGPDAYSYVFNGQWGSLDHALAGPSLRPQVTGVGEMHVNADEPSVLDYNTNFKSAGQVAGLYAPDRFRASDHDPVLVGLDLVRPTASAGGPYTVPEGGQVALHADAAGFTVPDPAYAWDLDGDGTFETAGRDVAFSAAGLGGPSSRTVRVRASDPGGHQAVAEAAVQVTDVAPVLDALQPEGAQGTACRDGNLVTLRPSVADPGPDGPWSIRLDWGDGAVDTVTAATGAQPPLVHRYAAGAFTIRASVADAAGVASPERLVQVEHLFAAGGVLGPVNADGSSNFEQGETIRLRLRITGCDGRPVAGLAPRVSLTRTGDGGGRVNEAGSGLPPTPGTLMVFRPLSGRYAYDLSTARSQFAGGRRLATGRYRVDIADAAPTARFPARSAVFDVVR